MALWILVCFFASIGFVQCGFWVAEALRRSDAFQHGYRLIPLYDDPEELEVHLRTVIARIFRESGGCDRIILVDMGMGEECQEICNRLVWGTSGVYICEPATLADTLTKLDNLQTAANDVE